MAQASSKRLDAGDPFPALDVRLVGGGSLRLPPEDGWTVLLLYRGHW